MKFLIKRTSFLKALYHGQSVVEKHNSIPILTHTLIQAENKIIYLFSTDLEISLIEEVQAEVTEKGSFALPTQTLYELVRKLPDKANIEISCKENTTQARLTSEGADYRLPCLSSQKFPKISQNTLTYQFKIPANTLYNMVNQCRLAMSTEETRYYLNGIYLHVTKKKELHMVATDGHRLVRMSMSTPEGAQEIPGCILPRKTINELLKLISNQKEDVHISLSKNQILFKYQYAKLSSRLIEGTFPNYEKVIPSSNNRIMRVSLRDFSSAIDRLATMASEKEYSVRLNIQDKKLELSATSTERGSGREKIKIDYKGISLEIGFNIKYLIDITQQIPSENIEFFMKDGNTATILYDSKNKNALYLLMPMRI